jgi:transcriptional regulator with XRE-family HTH domain
MEIVHPLKAFRNKQQPPMSRAELAGLLGVRRGTIHRWENGDRAIDPKLLPTVSEVTGIAPAELRPDLVELAETLVGVPAR